MPRAARWREGPSGTRVDGQHGRTSERSDDDIAHMRKVVGYVRRHGAQRPKGDVTDTDRRYSLMNGGHDPKKAQGIDLVSVPGAVTPA